MSSDPNTDTCWQIRVALILGAAAVVAWTAVQSLTAWGVIQ